MSGLAIQQSIKTRFLICLQGYSNECNYGSWGLESIDNFMPYNAWCILSSFADINSAPLAFELS